jgi:hypothetical protein
LKNRKKRHTTRLRRFPCTTRKVDPAQVDLHRHLPMFFDGIREKQARVLC